MAKLEDKLFNRVIEGKLDAEEEIVKSVEGAQSGTVASVLGLDSNGKLVKGSVSGGTQLYKHNVNITDDLSQELNIIIISANASFNNWQALRDDSKRVVGYVVASSNHYIIVGIELGDAINYFNGNTYTKVQMMMPRIVTDEVVTL